jgi:Ca2+-binding EF-hand superfamily protein
MAEMKPHLRIASLIAMLAVCATQAFADPKHGRKKPATHEKHAVERTYLFEEMDDNHDGVISRREWRGNSQSFREHDLNHNGVLSGAELRRPVERVRSARERHPVEPAIVGTTPRPAPAPRTTSIRTERDEVLFARRDTNHDGRITRDEWPDRAAFDRLDKNHDNVISPYEYGVGR